MHLLSSVEGIITEEQIPELEGLRQEPEGLHGVPLWCVTSYDLGWDSCTLGVHREVISPPSAEWFPPPPGRPGFIDEVPRNQTAGMLETVLFLVQSPREPRGRGYMKAMPLS